LNGKNFVQSRKSDIFSFVIEVSDCSYLQFVLETLSEGGGCLGKQRRVPMSKRGAPRA
jgi:hypothetical protein